MEGQDGGGSHDALMGAFSALDSAAQGWIYVGALSQADGGQPFTYLLDCKNADEIAGA